MAEAKGNITSLFGIPLYTKNVPNISNDVLFRMNGDLSSMVSEHTGIRY